MKKVARTAALVAVLSILLYLGIMAAVELWATNGSQYWLTLALLLPVEILLARSIYEAWRTGEIPVRFQVLSLSKNPASYWFTVGWSALMWVLMILISLLALRQLI